MLAPKCLREVLSCVVLGRAGPESGVTLGLWNRVQAKVWGGPGGGAPTVCTAGGALWQVRLAPDWRGQEAGSMNQRPRRPTSLTSPFAVVPVWCSTIQEGC